MRLIWLTDIHLNFLSQEARKIFYHEIIIVNPDAILISGDIAEAGSISDMLKEMVTEIQKPIYFVLGNHDYYRGQVDVVRAEMIALTKAESLLHWLPASGPQILKSNIVLVGQDGWADGRYGDYTNSNVTLNDSRMIADLFQRKVVGKYQLLEKMQQLADIDAAQLSENIVQTIELFYPKKIIVLTHVPPFTDSCMHQGKLSDDNWLPYFSCKAIGDVLLKFSKKYFEIDFLVLCGHTHSCSEYAPRNNLVIKAGKAEYYAPEIQSCALEY